MHREIDRIVEKRLFDLFGEQALAAHLRERAILDDVARGANHLDRDGLGLRPIGSRQMCAHLPRLPQRQRAATRADAQKRCRGLRHGTPQC